MPRRRSNEDILEVTVKLGGLLMLLSFLNPAVWKIVAAFGLLAISAVAVLLVVGLECFICRFSKQKQDKRVKLPMLNTFSNVNAVPAYITPVGPPQIVSQTHRQMNPITLSTFEEAVGRYFVPFARDNQWPLVRASQDVFEIQAPIFAMQIRFGIGAHSRNIDAVLIPASQNADASGYSKGGFGILAIAGYNGVDMEINPQQQTETGFLEYAQYVANYAQKFGLPYMLGHKSDSEKVKAFWRNKSEMELEKIKSYEFPPNVQKRWHLPPPENKEIC